MILKHYPAPPNLRALVRSFCLRDKVQLLCLTLIRPHLTCPALSIVPCFPTCNLDSCQIQLLSVWRTCLHLLSPPQPQPCPPPALHFPTATHSNSSTWGQGSSPDYQAQNGLPALNIPGASICTFCSKAM